jgi:hypothetical protein
MVINISTSHVCVCVLSVHEEAQISRESNHHESELIYIQLQEGTNFGLNTWIFQTCG